MMMMIDGDVVVVCVVCHVMCWCFSCVALCGLLWLSLVVLCRPLRLSYLVAVVSCCLVF